MRISTSTMYEAGVANMQQQSSRLMQLQQQIGASRRMLTPADDPSGSARVLEVTQSQGISQQYDSNIGTAKDSLSLEETVLASISNLLQRAKDVANSAGNGAYNQSDRISLAGQLRSQYQELMGLANSTDSSGQYLFAGYQSATRPFTQTSPSAVAWNGDEGQRLMQVGPTRQIEVSDSGDVLFRRVPAGNGSFTTQASSGNTGTGVIDTGNVLDSAKWNDAANNKDFTIQFSVSGGSTTYDIIDNTTLSSLLPGPRTYSAGSSIDLSEIGVFNFGAQVFISGAPADGDTFTIKKSGTQDVFKTIGDLATLLETSTDNTTLANGSAGLKLNLDNALNRVISVRSSVGSRLAELDGLKNGNDSLALQYSQSLSHLQDLDYAKASSDFAQQQMTLQAAQQSFVKVAGLSLFNYL